MRYILYNTKTGLINRVFHASSEFNIQQNIADNEDYIQNDTVTESSSYLVNGVITAYTEEERQIRRNLPPGFIWQMPERIAVDTRAIADAQKQAWAKIKLARAAAIAAPVAYNSNTYDMNTVSITSAVQMATLNSAYTITWTTASNTDVLLTAQEIIELGTAMHVQLNAAHDHARTLRKQIYQPNQTVAQIDAISW